GDAQAVADPSAVLVVGHVEVPDHALLDRTVALGELVDQVRDQLVALPVLLQVVALPGLLVVVGALDRRTGQPPGDLRTDGRVVAGVPLRLPQTAGDARLV